MATRVAGPIDSGYSMNKANKAQRRDRFFDSSLMPSFLRFVQHEFGLRWIIQTQRLPDALYFGLHLLGLGSMQRAV
jgi:hypothetical protein